MSDQIEAIWRLLDKNSRLYLESVPEGYDAYLLSRILKAGSKDLLFILREDLRMVATEEALRFFAPDIEVISFPAWDCLPYDRVSPNSDIIAERMTALGRILSGTDKPRIILTTVNAVLQYVPGKDLIVNSQFRLQIGDSVNSEEIARHLIANGFNRIGSVMDVGEFAIRGGLIDIFPPGYENPVRLDLFGDKLDGIRSFDPVSQKSIGKLEEVAFTAASEFLLDDQAVANFRTRYRSLFGPVKSSDILYESVTEKRKMAGMEHWLPLFQGDLLTLFDYLPDAAIMLDHLVAEARDSRLELINDYYETRKATSGTKDANYNPLEPGELYLSAEDWEDRLALRALGHFSPFASGTLSERHFDMAGKSGRNFVAERKTPDSNVYEMLRQHLLSEIGGSNRKVLLTHFTEGSWSRSKTVLKDHEIGPLSRIRNFTEFVNDALPVCGAVLGIENGFECPDFTIISEQDILGDRLVHPRKSRRRNENFITAAAQLSAGDYVVHVEHGIARFDGLKTIDISGAPHDCVTLTYDGNDRIYLPVENIELLSRYGSGDTEVALDKLGGSGWQARKARLKKKVMEMADQLIRIAAARMLKKADRLSPGIGAYAEFCAKFPYEETDDQIRAIDDVMTDMAAGKPMDRLICGDVGFGKTEVALRAAFCAAMSGKQVAVVTPTTLLSRQHFKTFTERFKGLPIRVVQLSRMVPAKQSTENKKDLAEGRVDIVIGTHALLAKSIEFRDLGLVVVDEEQHFGVAHKEQLKEMRANVHVLTLTATPIPRTLQLAMTGIRDLSIIATPPVDRLAIRTFVLPFDPVVIREALLREHYRGGQSFFVCPRLVDLDEVGRFLSEHVPEVKYAKAHGQLPPKQLDDVMNAFYDGKYDVLVSTNIVESGLDIPTANTLITYRADMFGLAQQYQIRGRIGRSKTRAYAYLTIPPRRRPTEAAEKRLRVLQSLDSLGAGFTLASHDLDIRGAGNLLGDEQSGHIREVGFELYQEMLEEAVAAARNSDAPGEAEAEDKWSPVINIGTSVLIPQSYVSDMNIRMDLYRRVADMEEKDDIDAFAVELVDRFGELPAEVEHLLKIMNIKVYCRRANIDKIEAGPKGATLSFRDQKFSNPAGLVEFISRQPGSAKLRADHKLVYSRRWDHVEDRLGGVLLVARNLAEISSIEVA